MKKYGLLLIIVVVLVSCSSLPSLKDFDLSEVYVTDFSKPEKWETVATATKKYQFVEGHYEISNKTENWYTYLPYWEKAALPYSFSATASLVLADPQKDGSICLVFNYADPGNFIRVQFNESGEYLIKAMVDGQTQTIQDWKFSRLIKKQGEKNTFTVLQTKDTAYIFANDKFLKKFPFIPADTKLEVGIGTGCGIGENLTLATSRYYSFSLSQIRKTKE